MKTTTQTETPAAAQNAQHTEYVTPEANIFETKDAYVVELEMPGVNKEGLDITVDGNEIAVLGRRANEVVNGETLLRERLAADFRRVFELDPAIDTAHVSAKMEGGILTLSLPKTEKVKPRKVVVGD